MEQYITLQRKKKKKIVIIYKATRNIKAGEEILLWFGDKYYNAWCKKYVPKVNVN